MLNAALPLLLLLLAAACTLCQCRLYPRPAEETPDYWTTSAREELRRADAAWQRLRSRARNVVLFVGDGLGLTTVTPARILKGQLANRSGEEEHLEFDDFPHVGLSKTYAIDRQTADSGETATAIFTGVKINNGVIGINQNVPRASCTGYRPAEHDVMSFLRLAAKEGRSAGIVTTTRITHATPASAFANCPDRNWEDDTDRATETRGTDPPEQRLNCSDIASQLVEKASDFAVVLGGGRLKFLPKMNQTFDPLTNKTVNGTRSDGVDLIGRWRDIQRSAGRQHQFVETREQLMGVDTASVDRLLGLMSLSHMQYELDRNTSSGIHQPSLAEMTEVALKVLRKNANGFVLMVEAGRIDHGHHAAKAQLALHDTLALDRAVGVAKSMTSEDDTLLIVTGDHGHVFTIGHYGHRGQPVTDLKYKNSSGEYELADDSLPYAVLNYADGPGATKGTARRNITSDNVADTPHYIYPALIPFSDDSHGGEDVGIYARGPGSHLFHSVHEQSYIGHVIMRTACIGWYAGRDNCAPMTTVAPVPSAAGCHGASGALMLLVALLLAFARL